MLYYVTMDTGCIWQKPTSDAQERSVKWSVPVYVDKLPRHARALKVSLTGQEPIIQPVVS